MDREVRRVDEMCKNYDERSQTLVTQIWIRAIAVDVYNTNTKWLKAKVIE
jgi:hypothetical protein